MIFFDRMAAMRTYTFSNNYVLKMDTAETVHTGRSTPTEAFDKAI